MWLVLTMVVLFLQVPIRNLKYLILKVTLVYSRGLDNVSQDMEVDQSQGSLEMTSFR